MGKYDLLREHLRDQPRSVKSLVLTIEEIRDIINAPLPPGAWNEGVFWANDNPEKGRWTRSAAWMRVGWMAHEDVANGQVRFTRRS